MNELMKVQATRNLQWNLLTTVSAMTLLAAINTSTQSRAAEQDGDRPTVWIELGSQLEKLNQFGDPYAPPFSAEIVDDGFTSPLKAQRALAQSFGGEGSITFQPKRSDWIFSVSARYGKANGGGADHEQTPAGPRKVKIGTSTDYFTPAHGTARFSETHVKNSESHTILDFQAGRDLGLGLFGAVSHTSMDVGVRVAQFVSSQQLGMKADPDFYFPSQLFKYAYHHHSYQVTSHMDRSFRGLGPTISWNGYAPVLGDTNDGGVTLDWGVNAAVLFGRQKDAGHHQSTVDYFKTKFFQYRSHVSHFVRAGNPISRSRSVIVPNIGGFAGASVRFTNAKVSFGYRADFFFDALDAGVGTYRSQTLGFHGPFATISIGLGG